MNKIFTKVRLKCQQHPQKIQSRIFESLPRYHYLCETTSHNSWSPGITQANRRSAFTLHALNNITKFKSGV